MITVPASRRVSSSARADAWARSLRLLPAVLYAVLVFPVSAASQADAAPEAAWRMRELFWAAVVLMGFVLAGLAWAGVVRRQSRLHDKAILKREEALAAHHRDLFENAHDILFTLDATGRFLSLNLAGEQVLGFRREEVAGTPLADLAASGQRERLETTLRDVRSRAANGSCELDLRAKNGRRVVLRVNVRGQSYPMETGSLQGMAWDITAQREAEEALHASEARLRRAFEERVQLGRDLHDGIIQSLYGVGLGLQETSGYVETDPAGTRERIAKAVANLNQLIREVRGFIGGLEPEALTGREFKAALEILVEPLRAAGPTAFTFDIDAAAARLLDTRQATHLLQIGREAISNSVRHGRALRTTVTLRCTHSAVTLEIRDDGAGFEPATVARPGHGLRNIAARAADLGGRSDVVASPGNGTCVTVTLPRAS